MKTKKIKIVKDRWDDGLFALEISHNGWQTLVVNALDRRLKEIKEGN